MRLIAVLNYGCQLHAKTSNPSIWSKMCIYYMLVLVCRKAEVGRQEPDIYSLVDLDHNAVKTLPASTVHG